MADAKPGSEPGESQAHGTGSWRGRPPSTCCGCGQPGQHCTSGQQEPAAGRAGGAQAGAGVPWGGWGAGVCPMGQVGCRRHRCAQTSGEQGTELVPIQNFPVSGMVLASLGGPAVGQDRAGEQDVMSGGVAGSDGES